MQYIQHILLVLVLLCLAKTQTLAQKYEKNKLIIEIQPEENEILIDFYNQDNQFFDQLFCKVQECLCIFTKENINSSILKEPECENQKMILERSVPNLKAILNVNRKRIMAAAYTDTDMTDSKVIDSRLTLKWKFNSDSTIEFATIWNKKTWLGIGFGSTMRNVDMITINVVGTSVEIIDLYSTSDNTPPTDSSQDYTLVSFEVGSASVKTRFKRKLSTGDSQDKTLTSGSSYNWCYAYSSGQTMEMHTVKLGFSITLTNTASSSSSGTGSSTSGTSGTGTSTSGTGTSTSGTGTSTSGTGTSTSGTGTSTSGTGTSTSGTGTTTSGTGTTTSGTGTSSSGTGTSTSGTGTSTSGTGTSTSGSGSTSSSSGTGTSSSSGTGSSSSGTSSTSSSSGTDTSSSSSGTETTSSSSSESGSENDSESTSSTSGTTYTYKSTSYGTISLALFSLAIYLF